MYPSFSLDGGKNKINVGLILNTYGFHNDLTLKKLTGFAGLCELLIKLTLIYHFMEEYLPGVSL